MSAIDYDLITNYLISRKEAEDNKSALSSPLMGISKNAFSDGGSIEIKNPGRLTNLKKRTGKTEAELWSEGDPSVRKMITFARNARKWNKAYGGLLNAQNNLFAIGGDIQANGADFSTGLTHVNAGGSHEENPAGGVQMGVDEQGVPNMVEEGEVIFNDYVFSNRIELDAETKKSLHFPIRRSLTYADAAKKLEVEIKERPNDPISRAGFLRQMQTLEDNQERQKQEMAAENARRAFESLSPEEQTAIMQQYSQQQSEQQAMEEQPQEVSPEEAAMAEQAQMQQAVPEEAVPAEAMMPQMAEGGRLYADGGVLADPETIVVPATQKANVFASGNKMSRRLAKRYDNDWFLARARALGMIGNDATSIDGFTFNANDPRSNLDLFNTLYRKYQRDKALEAYIEGQRQSKENSLFGRDKLYRISNDNSKIYKRRTNDTDRIGWINSDYTGALDKEGKVIGYLNDKEYNALPDDKKATYKKINERAGDFMYGYNGQPLEDFYDGTKEGILDSYKKDYEKGFKWDDSDAQVLRYPANMEHSKLSYLRYAPIPFHTFSILHNLFSPADYSSAEAMRRAGSVAPRYVYPHFNPTYMKPHVVDILTDDNRSTALLNTALGNFGNTSNPNRSANQMAAIYNATLLNGRQRHEADTLNRKDAFNVITHNSGQNDRLANYDMQAQVANQGAHMNAARMGYQGVSDAERLKAAIDANRNSALNINLKGLVNSLRNLGEEAYDEDRLAWLENTGTLKSKYFNGWDKYDYGLG